jgi:hypothetical protein
VIGHGTVLAAQSDVADFVDQLTRIEGITPVRAEMSMAMTLRPHLTITRPCADAQSTRAKRARTCSGPITCITEYKSGERSLPVRSTRNTLATSATVPL